MPRLSALHALLTTSPRACKSLVRRYGEGLERTLQNEGPIVSALRGAHRLTAAELERLLAPITSPSKDISALAETVRVIAKYS